ncbi:MAG: hypothetical protein ACYT04_81900, partial [Nostoc sp.]
MEPTSEKISLKAKGYLLPLNLAVIRRYTYSSRGCNCTGQSRGDEELVLDLLTDPESQFEVSDAPAEVQTYMQWV